MGSKPDTRPLVPGWGAVLWVFVFVLTLFPVRGYDVWWHLKTGEIIFANGALPTHDLYSFAAAGAPWALHEWLAQVILYGIHSLVGFPGLLVLRAACKAVVVLLVYVLLRRRGVGVMAGLLLALFASFFIRSSIRPYLFSYVIFMAMILLIDRRWAKGPGWGTVVAMVLLSALWANLHGAFVAGIALLGLLVVGRAIPCMVVRLHAGGEGRAIGGWLLVGVLMTVAALANPYGWHALVYPFAHQARDPLFFESITEFQPLVFFPVSTDTLFILLPFLLGGLLLAGAVRFDRRRLGAAAAVIVFLFLAVQQRRHVPYCLLTGLLLLAGPGAAGATRFVVSALLMAAVAAILATAQIAVSVNKGLFEGAVAVERYPERAVREIERAGFDGPMLNHFEWGGYLVWRLHPDRQVFVSGCMPLAYDDVIFPDYFRLLEGEDVDEILARHGFMYSILPDYNPMVRVLKRAGWTVRFYDKEERSVIQARVRTE